MSTKSPQEKAAEENASLQAALSQQLSGIALPELRSITGQLTGALDTRDPSGKLAMDAQNYNAARGVLGQSYGQAKNTSRESIAYNALRSGEATRSPNAVSSAITSSAAGLDRDMASALRRLEFQSAQTGMKDYNQILQLLGQDVSTGLNLGGGFSGAANSAIGMMSNQSPFGSTLGGASAGAGLGASVGGPWGALIGGVAGGAAGYFGST